MCISCGVKANFILSKRTHGKHPAVQFRICKACGKDVQGTIQGNGTFREFSTAVKKGGTNKLQFRFSDDQLKRMRRLRKNPRQLAERGLIAFESE